MWRTVKFLALLFLLITIPLWLTHHAGVFPRASAHASSVSSTVSGSPSATHSQTGARQTSQASNSASSAAEVDATSTFIAFRYDGTRVLFRVSDEISDFELDASQSKTLRSLGGPVAVYDKGQVWEADQGLLDAHREFFNRAHAGEQWQLELSADSRILAVVQKPVVATAGCFEYAGFLAEVLPAGQKEFAASAKQYFLIHRKLDTAANQTSGSKPTRVGPLVDRETTPELRSEIEKLLDARMKAELPKVHADSVPEYERAENVDETLKAWSERWKTFDDKLARGEGKLDYDMQAFQLTPDGVPRLFVRAEWTIDGKPAFLMSLWLRAKPALAVDHADAGWAGIMRMRELMDSQLDLETLGNVLNVFDLHHDGYGQVLIYSTGYEGYGISLYRFTDAGLTGTKIAHGGGC